MATTVWIFAHSGVISAPRSNAGGFLATDSISQLKQPYSARETLSCDIGAPSSSISATAPDKTGVLFIQVQPGKVIHYEVNPPNRSVVATTDSPRLTGDQLIQFGPEWTISVVGAAV